MKKLITIVGCFIFLLTAQTIAAQDFVPVTYTVETPEEVTKSDGFAVTVNFKTRGDWYIYAPTGQNEKHGMIETKFKFNLPVGITLGKIDLPMPQPYGMYQIYKGDEILMSQHFNVNENIEPGTYEIECIVTFQTCDKSVCLPPDTKTYKKTINIK